MKTRLLLSIILLSFFATSEAQLQPTPVNITNNLKDPKPEHFIYSRYGKAGSCGEDTLYYPYYKSTGFYAIALNASTSGSGFAQYYPAPQAVKVSGFTFFAFQSGAGSPVTLTANLYLATGDSLPLGSPVRTTTIVVDTTFGQGLLATMRKQVNFPNPPTLSVPYVITLETSSSTNVSVICNSYIAGDGDAEYLSGVALQGSWRRSNTINVGTYPFNADFIMMPTVSYALTADFFFTGCNEGNTTFNFTNTSSDILENRFYNRYAFYGIPQYGYRWDFGDTTLLYYQKNATHLYKNRMAYTVTLRDTMYGWTIGCVDYAGKTVPYTPLPPGLTTDGPVCSGDSLHIYADTVPGLTYKWTGPDNFSSTHQNLSFYNADTAMNGEYTLQVSYMNCASKDTAIELEVWQTPQKPVATNDGPKCVGDSVVFTAQSPSPGITYRWSGPNAFMDSSDGFVFYALDTNDVGTYYVFAHDQHCISDTDSTVLYTYPPPQIPTLQFLSNDSICIGDTIRFEGLSVTGALFDWLGPESFQSSDARLEIPASDTLQSGWYSSRVVIGSCVSNRDSIHLTVLRTPVTSPILGMDTSTEFLTKTYQSPKDYRDGLVWTCLGGTILSMDSVSGDVTVKWGPEGIGKLVVSSFSPDGCYGFSERINVEILPTPLPPDNTSIRSISSGLVKVYPNPAKDYIILEYPEELNFSSYELFNALGQSIAKGTMDNKIDLTALHAGTYHLIVQGTSGIESLRIQVLP